jgi:hypothetical protein
LIIREFYPKLTLSYAFSVAFFITGFGINWLFFKAEFYSTFITLAVIFVLLTPVVYRMSRSVWIHFFVKYDKRYAGKKA